MSKSRLPKRARPTTGGLALRAEFLSDLANLSIPSISPTLEPLLELGNSKIGKSGRFARTAFVWNLPAIATCPGASRWCSAHCYNADARTEKFPLGLWANNWAWAVERPADLEVLIVKKINEAAPPVAVRIHSSGDFFSPAYVALWLAICRRCPETHFWAYTRSWQNPSLAAGLAELRHLPNVELFASWDATMPQPPIGWRLSIVVEGGMPDGTSDVGALQCPEEDGRVSNCANCGYCFTRRPGDVVFALH